ncbi:alpha-N-arabinofuranosidase [Fibrisoma montanum]|uniref:Alpha-N-arabinofuranosidase n=1 Tax=Fibrisoma montanum TaxID=2305895 RepID=A0A418MEH5_9BACT|nr:glycoside hydrolase family 43 protein [Fibrisoma montanum]RIV25137.1 alpha-N-arabinofuranosidase [Fibrisoma montanum]
MIGKIKSIVPALGLTLLGTVSGFGQQQARTAPKLLSKPLVSHIYTADPSAHVFNGRIYIYPSHDYEAGVPEDDLGSHFAMRDYHVLSMDRIDGKVTDHGVALDIKNIPWAGKQLWAPDAAYKNGTYYLYFPVKDKQGVFRIGVATSKSPTGPFKAEPAPMKGSLSIDPAVFTDANGQAYMYVGGIWGGQLQRWRSGKYDPNGKEPAAAEPALGPKVARLTKDMLEFDEPLKEIKILDKAGKPLLAGDNKRRFFEGGWMHKYKDKYYFSYSTGDTHFLAYATGTSPYGPFTYQGVILTPVQGWTTHHSIIEFKGKWYLFYHDTELSGKTHLRNVKVTELTRKPDGSFETINYPASTK